jgi:membrane protease YdiL (CAAX protease family)
MKSKVLALLKSPVYLMFAVLYVLAVILRSTAGIVNTAVYLGMDAALIGLICFIYYYMTKKRESITIQYREPGLELAIGLMLVGVGWSIFPSMDGLKWWDAGEIIKKNVINVLLLTVLCLIRRTPLWKWRETRKNFWHDVGLGFTVLLIMTVPAAFYGGTMQKILNGSLKLQWLPGLLGISFVHKLFYSGLHEEFFYRGFVQSRLGAAFNSEWQGLVAASLYFGLFHTMGNQLWGYNAGLMGGFTESMFVQTFHGLVFGMLWMRTKSIIPGVIVHSGLNAVTNLAAVAQSLGWL